MYEFFATLTTARKASYGLLGLALGLTMATANFIVPVKITEFYTIVGADQDPLAKSLIIVVLVPILILYNMLVSALPGPVSLVWLVSIVYAAVYGALAMQFYMLDPPDKWVAWVLYYATETKGVIVMPMLWSVIAEVSTSELSKISYPVVFALIQTGGIGGSFVAIFIRSLGGPVTLMFIQAALFIIVAAICHMGVALVASEKKDTLLEKVEKPKKKPHEFVLEGVVGLWLLLSRPFALGIFWVSYATLVPRTVLDYESSVLIYGTMTDNDARVAFWGKLSLYQNLAILALTLLGTGPLVKCLGVGVVLGLLPVVMLGCIGALCYHYDFWTSIVAIFTASFTAFGLNSPCKEMLFTRTSRDIKYKAKSWSEMWGNNFMKLLGSQINLFFNKPDFSPIPTMAISVVWVAIWLGVVAYVGNTFYKLEKSDKLIE